MKRVKYGDLRFFVNAIEVPRDRLIPKSGKLFLQWDGHPPFVFVTGNQIYQWPCTEAKDGLYEVIPVAGTISAFAGSPEEKSYTIENVDDDYNVEASILDALGIEVHYEPGHRVTIEGPAILINHLLKLEGYSVAEEKS